MKLVVGLGNPGDDYQNTRHNTGFYMLDLYLESKGLTNYKSKFNGLYITASVEGEKVIFLKPQSFMNLSGEVIRKFVDFYKIDVNDIFIIHDDLDLPIGSFRLKATGSSGGHNGLKNIESHLKTQKYKRLKVGISHIDREDTIEYVLGKFSKNEQEIIEKTSIIIGNLLDDYFKMSFDSLMNKYNRKIG